MVFALDIEQFIPSPIGLCLAGQSAGFPQGRRTNKKCVEQRMQQQTTTHSILHNKWTGTFQYVHKEEWDCSDRQICTILLCSG